MPKSVGKPYEKQCIGAWKQRKKMRTSYMLFKEFIYSFKMCRKADRIKNIIFKPKT